jgi:hypothetical protein
MRDSTYVEMQKNVFFSLLWPINSSGRDDWIPSQIGGHNRETEYARFTHYISPSSDTLRERERESCEKRGNKQVMLKNFVPHRLFSRFSLQGASHHSSIGFQSKNLLLLIPGTSAAPLLFAF